MLQADSSASNRTRAVAVSHRWCVQHRDKRLSRAEHPWSQVLRAMRGELGKEIKRLETTYAANDARVVHLVNASAGRMQARPPSSL